MRDFWWFKRLLTRGVTAAADIQLGSSLESAMKSVSLLLVGIIAGVVSFWVAIDRQKFCKGDLLTGNNPVIGMTKKVVRTESYSGNWGQ
jgi:hypothetical protein